MDQWIKNLWEKNKIIFWLLIPLILLFLFKNLIIELLLGSSRKRTEEVKKKDDKLEQEFIQINNEADKIREEANKPPPVVEDEDWHKKRK